MTGLEHFIDRLRNDRDFMACVTRWERIEPREGRYAPLPSDLDSRLLRALGSRGIDRLYTHQALAYDHARGGGNCVVVTPTASGKTLCYNLPVLQTIIERPESRALYLFPTKALSQDQQAELGDVVIASELGMKVATYDGDTPESLRASARETGQIIISNPDMLHSGILPNHPKWIKFLKHLRFVVIDELHSYRGIFGSHVTNVIRRLKRICAFYGTQPVFICSSATIGNPGALAEAVLEAPVTLIDRNGAPSGERHVVLYNPPLVDRVQGIRRGVVNEAQRVAIRLLRERIKTIVFSRSRIRTELIADYINKTLANMYTDNERIRVEAYRGGYLPSERRAVEKGLRDGSVHGVVSTNALELGIDIGGLDASILGGFPGSIASSWQQLGRAGRRQTVSLSILIASVSPLDQYMVKHPDYFFGRTAESAFIDPNNMYVLLDHLKCAVFELPFEHGEGFPGPVDEHLAVLEEEGTIRLSAGRWYWADRSYPAEGISLRSATSDNVVIVDITDGANSVIGEMDRPSAKEMLFDNAIYLHRGEQFVVTQLDLHNRRAFVKRSDGNYFTDGLVKRDIKVLLEDRREDRCGCLLVVGDILVRSQVTKFKKIRFRSHENVGYGDISLPEEEMHTRALALVFAPGSTAGDAVNALPSEMLAPAMARIGSVIRNVAPFFLLCDAGDIGIAERLRDPHFGAAVLYVYDNYPGGSGLAEALVKQLSRVLRAARDLIADCPCEQGCPSCVGPRDPAEEIESDPKLALRQLLDAWAADPQVIHAQAADAQEASASG